MQCRSSIQVNQAWCCTRIAPKQAKQDDPQSSTKQAWFPKYRLLLVAWLTSDNYPTLTGRHRYRYTACYGHRAYAKAVLACG